MIIFLPTKVDYSKQGFKKSSLLQSSQVKGDQITIKVIRQSQMGWCCVQREKDDSF